MWRKAFWRRNGGDDLGRDLIDQLLLARGVGEADLARHRQPTIRDFLPDPSVFQDMDKAAARHQVEWRWVRGHSGDEGNERADALARRGRDQAAGR